MFKRVKQEIEGIKEPKILQEEADFMDFDSVEKVLEKNLSIFEEAQSAQEVYHTTFHNQMKAQSDIADVMAEIQDLIQEEVLNN